MIGVRRRWAVAGMLLVLSALSYVDRQALAVLATTIQAELSLSDREYARVVQAFLICYGAAYFAAGRLVDRVGPRLAETLFVAWWSVANMLTGLATGFGSLLFTRSLLGLGEPGHYAVAAKATGRWFAPAERGIVVSMYTMGGTLGAAAAAPLVAWLTIAYGWRSAIVVTGALGVVLAVVWWLIYRDPETGASAAPAAPPMPLRALLRSKALWLIVALRMVTDPVWYFYLNWFSKYLREVRDFTLEDVGGKLWLVFVMADVGCMAAGWASGRLVRRVVSPVGSKLRVMAVCAAALAFSFTVPLAPGAWAVVAVGGVHAAAALAFISCAVAMPLELFPAGSLGSAQGVIGTGGSLGGALSTGAVAWAVTNWSYDVVFTAMCFTHPLALAALAVLLPLARRADGVPHGAP